MHESQHQYALVRKCMEIPQSIVVLAALLTGVGCLMLYSASQGQWQPWAFKHAVRFVVLLPVVYCLALLPIRWFFHLAYLLFIGGLVLLVAVLFLGVEGGLGAQRWLAIGGFRFQPSELIKLCLIVGLARYFHAVHRDSIRRLVVCVVPVIMIGLAAGMIVLQPNLGTAVIVVALGGGVMFLAGVGWKKFMVAGLLMLAAIPLLWMNMHTYQKARVHTFFNPEADPLGHGYNIIQSKIAIGSGGFWGKGFLQGTQSQLNFVPEQQTDFIFSIVSEEWGFLGAMLVLLLYGLLLFAGMRIAASCQHRFGMLGAYGVTLMLFLHVCINVAMVMGLLPVVGVPLPMLSYGGSSMLGTMLGLGLLMNVYVHRREKVGTYMDG